MLNIKINRIMTRSYLNYFIVICVAALFVSCNCDKKFKNANELVVDRGQKVEFVSVELLKEKYDNGDMFLLIDVREPREYNLGYIPGAVNVPGGVLVFKIGEEAFWESEMLYMPENDEEIIVYSNKGRRGVLAAHSLELLGYTNVKYLDGGWKNWELTYPLEYEKNLDLEKHEEQVEEGGC